MCLKYLNFNVGSSFNMQIDRSGVAKMCMTARLPYSHSIICINLLWLSWNYTYIYSYRYIFLHAMILTFSSGVILEWNRLWGEKPHHYTRFSSVFGIIMVKLKIETGGNSGLSQWTQWNTIYFPQFQGLCKELHIDK